jgi:transcriptional regulator with XRE-family HTH domain
MADDWAKQMTDRIGETIRELREPQSVQWLEDRTDELGHRVSRSTVNELENKRRKSITLADVMVLAAALEVPVGHLIYPPDGPIIVEALPDLLIPRADAIEFLGGTVTDIQHDREELADALQKADEARATIEKLAMKVDGMVARGEIPPAGKRLVQTGPRSFKLVHEQEGPGDGG